MKRPTFSYLSLAITLILAIPATSDEQALTTLIQRLNSDVIELRNEIEFAYANRCDTINGCSRNSYDECQSELSAAQTCPSFSELGYAVEECGRGETCNALFDYELTTVRLPANLARGPNKNPTDPVVSVALKGKYYLCNESYLNTNPHIRLWRPFVHLELQKHGW